MTIETTACRQPDGFVERLECASALARLLSRNILNEYGLGVCDNWVDGLNRISREIDEALDAAVGMHIAPEILMQIIKKHASGVTFAFLCDLLPMLGMEVRVSVIDGEAVA